MGCSPPPAHNGPPGVLAGSCRQTGRVMETERGGRGGGTGRQEQGGRGEEGRSQSGAEAGGGSA